MENNLLFTTLDRERVRVIKNSPNWIPAKLDAKPIKAMIEMS